MKKKCTPCNSKSLKMSKFEISNLLEEVPEYDVFEAGGALRISKLYTFKNFKEALAFTNKLGEIAEEENHHPEIILEWGKVKVSWWTHSIGGLHTNDFVMALKSEKI